MFISKANKRRIKLTHYLQNQLHPTSYEELMKVLQTTRRVIYEDLTFLKANFPEVSIWMGSDFTRLRLPDHIRIDHYERSIIKKSNAFQLLEFSLLEPNLTRLDLCERLEVSQTTLYRLVKQINQKELVNYDLELSLSPFKIIGEEDKIRIFFKQLYTKAYAACDWPFEQVNLNQLEPFLMLGSQVFNFTLTFSTKVYWASLVAINLIRYQQGHYLVNQLGHAEEYYKILSHDYFKGFRQAYETATGYPFNEETISQLFFPFIQEDYMAGLIQIGNQSIQDSLDPKLCQKINLMLNQFKQEANLNIPDQEKLVQKLESCVLINDKNTIQSANTQLRDRFIQGIKEDFPALYREVNQMFTSLYTSLYHEESRLVVNELIYLFFVHSVELFKQLQIRNKSIPCLLILDMDVQYQDYIITWLNWHFGQRLIISTYDKSSIELQEIIHDPNHLIITNMTLDPIKGKVVVCIDDYPSQINYHILSQTIEEINEKKLPN